MRDDEARPRKRRRPPARRKTVRWSAREVDALLAGVRHHGVGKWAAILRHSKVFNGVRTSVDLKDKWRNLTSPVRAAALAARAAPDPPALPPDDDKVEPLLLSAASLPCSPARSRSCSPAASQGQPSPGQSQSDVLSLSHSHQPSQGHSQAHSDSQAQSQCHSQSQSQPHSQSQSHSQSNSQSHTQTLSEKIHVQSKSQLCPDSRNETAVLPPPPSESSVSPEVLSTPASHPPPQSVHQQYNALPLQSLQHHHQLQQQQYPAPAIPNASSPHTAAMQHAFNQSLYHSATAMVAYWRRLGHEPSPYAIAAALTASSASNHMHSYYVAGAASGLYSGYDDDDDDDDDDDVPPSVPLYPIPFSPMLSKDAVHMPMYPAYAQPFPPPPPPGSSTVPLTTPVAVHAPSSAGQRNDQPAPAAPSVAVTNAPPVSPVEGQSGKTEEKGERPESENQPAPATEERTEGRSRGEEEEEDTAGGSPPAEEDEIVPVAQSEMEYFNVEDFPMKSEKTGDQDEGSLDGDQLGNTAMDTAPLGFASQSSEDQQAFPGTDLA